MNRAPSVEITDPELDRLFFEVQRRATPGQRLDLTWALSEVVMVRLRKELEWLHPDADKDEIDLLFVDYCYGREVMKMVQRCRAARSASPIASSPQGAPSRFSS
jgi:hypothetical protein